MEDSNKDPSVWDDPELVPPPVFMYDASQDEHDEGDDSGFEAHEAFDETDNIP